MSVSIYPFLFIVAAIVAAVGIKMLISSNLGRKARIR